MPLDPEADDYLEMLRRNRAPSLESLSVSDARAQLIPMPDPPEPMAEVEDQTVPGVVGGIPVRIYRPTPRKSGNRPGAIVFFHGGGWVLGNLDSHDGLCRRLALTSGMDVIAVDYRLAPEHRFPAAVDDCEAVTRWVSSQSDLLKIDPKRIVVCGDSAGGNLAAVVACRLRNQVPLAAQVLLYPITDHSFETPSYRENAEGYFLSRATMEWFWNHYLGNAEDGQSVDASPLKAKGFEGLPSAYILTAGYDPLRDEGRAYAQHLIAAGVDVTFRERSGMVHGFLRRLDRFPSAGRSTLDEIAAFLSQFDH